MPDERKPRDGSDPRDRLEALDRAVKDALHRRDAEHREAAAREAQMRTARREGAAWRVVIDVIAATLLGSLAGFVMDRTLGSLPLGLIVGLFSGFALGMWRAAKSAARLQAQANSAQEPGTPHTKGGPGEDRSEGQ